LFVESFFSQACQPNGREPASGNNADAAEIHAHKRVGEQVD
jgi:hypothetical protein